MADNKNTQAPGLSNLPKNQWPKISAAESVKAPIDRLRPGSDLHAKVRDYLLLRLNTAEKAMSQFHPRWSVNEKKIQAYLDLPDYEQQLKELNDSGEVPSPVSIVIPYTFAVISTIVTYFVHTFTGRKPMFQVGSHKDETAQSAQMMEIVLQYNADHTRLIKTLFQFLLDGVSYGVGVMRARWKNERKLRTVWVPQDRANIPGLTPNRNGKVKVREERLVYSGNEVSPVDPYMFFPDPNVPMTEVNKLGEYVWWRSFTGLHTLKEWQAEVDSGVKYLDAVGTPPKASSSDGNTPNSSRALRADGISHPGQGLDNARYSGKNYNQVDQGSVTIIPAELGLGDSERPEKWVFTIINKRQIVQAQPLQCDHDMHPVVVTEPYTVGYGFGNLGMADYLSPVQDTASWLINSHMDNVKTALNNMWVVDPNAIVMQDLIEPGPGKIIRLRQSAQGRDLRTIVQQLQVADVTRSHLGDLEGFMKVGDTLSSISDNLKGQQDPGGRKTATEVRTSGEAAASRLASTARLISAQAMVDLTEQLSLNIQQYLDDEFYISIVGMDGLKHDIRDLASAQGSINIAPESLTGDFHFPIHDGVLPLDRVAMLDVWKEIFITIAGNQLLAQEYSLPKVFEFIAQLGGATNLDAMRIKTVPDNVLAGQEQAGNAIPLNPGAGPLPAAPGLQIGG